MRTSVFVAWGAPLVILAGAFCAWADGNAPPDSIPRDLDCILACAEAYPPGPQFDACIRECPEETGSYVDNWDDFHQLGGFPYEELPDSIGNEFVPIWREGDLSRRCSDDER